MHPRAAQLPGGGRVARVRPPRSAIQPYSRPPARGARKGYQAQAPPPPPVPPHSIERSRAYVKFRIKGIQKIRRKIGLGDAPNWSTLNGVRWIPTKTLRTAPWTPLPRLNDPRVVEYAGLITTRTQSDLLLDDQRGGLFPQRVRWSNAFGGIRSRLGKRIFSEFKENFISFDWFWSCSSIRGLSIFQAVRSLDVADPFERTVVKFVLSKFFRTPQKNGRTPGHPTGSDTFLGHCRRRLWGPDPDSDDEDSDSDSDDGYLYDNDSGDSE
jgi:hypothetical protein